MASGHVSSLLVRTSTCVCQPSAQREAKVRSTHDTCFPADKGNKQSKNIRHLGRTASKRRRTEHFSYGSKKAIRIHSRQMEARWCVKWTLAGPKSKWKRWKTSKIVLVMSLKENWEITASLYSRTNTDGCTPPNKNSGHPKFRAAIQERHEVSAAFPSAHPDIPKPNLQHQQQWQQQHCHRNQLEEHLNFDWARITSVRNDVWHLSRHQMEWLVGVTRIWVGNSSPLFPRSIHPTDGNLSVTDGWCEHHIIHNDAFPAFADLSMHTHILSRSDSFSSWIKTHTAPTQSQPWFCVLEKKVICCRSDVHPSLVSLDTSTH